MSKINVNGVVRDMTAEEQAIHDADFVTPKSLELMKLDVIKQMRLEKLIETDYLAMSDNVLSDEMKAFRKKMRDIPQDFTTESQYDLLLARDSEGNLTHSIWSKP